MRGYRNHAAVLAPFVERVERGVLLAPARLWHWPARGYPALELAGGASPSGGAAPLHPTSSPANAVRGELVWVREAEAAHAMSRLDALEDFHGPGDARNEYDRVLVTASADGAVGAPSAGPVRAWTYVVARSLRSNPGEAAPVPVDSGCWRSYLASAGLEDAGDARFVPSRGAVADTP